MRIPTLTSGPARTPRPFSWRPFSWRSLSGLGLCTLVACGTWSTPPARTAPAVALTDTDRPVRKIDLPAGLRLELLPAVIRPGSTAPPKAYLVDAWWRTATEQSVRFDIAAGLDSVSCASKIRLHFDVASNTFAATLIRAEQPPLPLATVVSTSLAVGLDRLAILTRVALGEKVHMAPIPCLAAYSASRDCVRFTEHGRRRIADGDPRGGLRLLTEARSHDGGCALTLLALASSAANQGGDAAANQAMRTLNEALHLRHRLTPRSEHRLARALLIVRRDDAKLIELGKAYGSDRPHDPHGHYTHALGLSKSGDYAASRPILERLRARWPRNPFVRYQLAFALLATGEAKTALEVLEEAKRQLGTQAIARPFAMALFHSGKAAELKRYLANLRRLPGIAGGPAELEVIRMQASAAILAGDEDTAVIHLTTALNWVRENASNIDRYSLDVAEDAEVLLRIGAPQQLVRRSLNSFQALGQLPQTFRNAVLYIEGLLKVDNNQAPVRELTTLAKSSDTVWHNRLLAAMHQRRGELAEATAALERAVSGTSHPMLQANAARALNAAGQTAAAAKIATFVRAELLAFDQRKPREHPLMSPGRALAYLATAK